MGAYNLQGYWIDYSKTTQLTLERIEKERKKVRERETDINSKYIKERKEKESKIETKEQRDT